MTKYQPLADRLAGHPHDEWRTSFSELEGVLGFALPKTARSAPAWWGNDGDRGPSRSWVGVGWTVVEVDHTGGLVIFRRNLGVPDIEAAGGLEPSASAEPRVLGRASEGAGSRPRLRRSAPAIAAGAVVVAGVAAWVARKALRRKAQLRASGPA